MRSRLFKLVFLVSVLVFFLAAALMAVWLYLAEPAVGLVQLFMPLLGAMVLAVVLSAVLAHLVAKTVTRSLDNIDFSRPDERDVEQEIKPLVRRLADQNRQIRSQMEQLDKEHKRQDKMRREFTANVSHELKTPLTSISGFAELLRDGLVRPEDQARFAGKIYDEAQRLIVLVGDILRLSRLEEQTQTIIKEPIDLRQMCLQTAEQLLSLAQKQDVTLQVEGTTAELMASGQIVSEIIYNLCDNAIKYNRPGGTVTMTVSQDEETVSLQVADTGIGIAKEELERIFERFYRVDKSRSRDVGGTGLGLSIVKHGAACHDAEVLVESEPGQGTAVTVVFPKGRKE